MPHRRELLAGAASALALVAGCLDTTDTPTTEEPTSTTTETTPDTQTDTPTDTQTTASPTETPTETPTDTPTETPTSTPTETPSSGMVTVAVAPNDQLVYDPDSITITAGTTVRWEWEGNGHNIAVSAKPDGSDWSGDNANLYDEGHVHEHTFTTAGEYEYYCEPHRSFGMVATITVTE